jgi:hypothetical protein
MTILVICNIGNILVILVFLAIYANYMWVCAEPTCVARVLGWRPAVPITSIGGAATGRRRLRGAGGAQGRGGSGRGLRAFGTASGTASIDSFSLDVSQTQGQVESTRAAASPVTVPLSGQRSGRACKSTKCPPSQIETRLFGDNKS